MMPVSRRVRCIVRGIAIIALPLIVAACAGEPSLVGLPLRDVESEREEANLLLQDVRHVEAALQTLELKSERHGAPLSQDEEREMMRAVLAAQLVLSDEHFSYEEPGQAVRPGRPPLQVYPRITCPAIVEPAEVTDSAGKRRLEWFVPVIFNKEAMYWDESFRTIWLGWPPERVRYDQPGFHVTGWLFPRSQGDDGEAKAIAVDPYLSRPKRVEVPIEGGGSIDLPDVLPTRSAYGLILPVKTEASGDGIEPGYYDLRLLPRIRPEGESAPELRGLASAVTAGDWVGALRELDLLTASIGKADPPDLRQDFGRFVDAIDAYPPTWFDPELDELRIAIVRVRDGARDLQGDLLRLQGAIRAMLRSRPHPAPVWLEAPSRPDEPFSFVVSGDWQYHADLTNLHQFLGLLDPAFLPNAGLGDARHALVAAPIQERIRKAKFVIAVGDLGDGQALSSSKGKAIVTSMGLSPPLSPYEDEFDGLARVLTRFRLPVFAVPGNHDAFANYGGLANDAFSLTGRLLKLPGRLRLLSPLFYLPGESFCQVGSVLPVVIKLSRGLAEPYFDGLVQWRFRLGPTQFAFRYRGHSFVGLNTYNLDVKYRDQVGALSNNWGGGVDRHDAVWFDVMLGWLRGEEAEGVGRKPLRQFVFMHQDPRAGRPFLRTYEEGEFGCYDAADAPLNTLTFGYLGLGWSSSNPLWLPIITPIMSNLPSQLLRGDANFNQEWMKKGTLTDVDCYGARPLIDAVNAHLAKGAGGSGISHIFFGHDDVPAVSQWVHIDQGGRVFPTEDGGDWPGTMWGPLVPIVPFFRTRTVAPPEWGREMVLRDGRNATVIRCDDVGQAGGRHGFHLVTVDPGKAPPEDVTVEWIEIPS